MKHTISQDQAKRYTGYLAVFVIKNLVMSQFEKNKHLAVGPSAKHGAISAVGGDLGTIEAPKSHLGLEPLVPEFPIVPKALKRPVRKPKQLPRVIAAAPTPATATATATDSNLISETVAQEPPLTSDIQLGFDVTSALIAPMVRYEMKTSPQTSVGAYASYSKNAIDGPQATLYGGGLSVSYYILGQVFDGFSIDGQLSMYDITAKTKYRSSHITPSVFMGSATWHGTIMKNFSYTLGGGVQYVQTWGKSYNDIYYHGLIPAARFTLGYAF